MIFTAANAADQAILHAFTPDGRALWSRTFERAFVSGIETSEALRETSEVFIALSSADLLRGEGMILALNEKGEEVWRWTGNVQKVSAPAVVDDLIYFTADGKTLVCLDTATGEEDQRWPLPVVASSAAPLIVDNVAYIACRGPQVLAYHFDGRVVWQYTHDDFAAWLDQTPVVIDDLLVAVSSRGEALVLDRHTGVLKRRVAIGSTDKPLSAPTADGSRIFIGARDGLYVLDAQTDHVEQWLKTERRIKAAPVIVGDVVYVTCHDHHLYALDSATGRELWRRAATQRIEIAPLILPDQALIVVADHGGQVTALRLPLTAEQLAQAGRWAEAAQAYAATGQLANQAEALIEHARQLESQGDAEQAGSIWEQAAQRFTQLDQPERAQACQNEVLRCWHFPVLTVEIQAHDLRVDEWSAVDLMVRNDGYGPAHNIIIHAEGDQFTGRVMETREIVTLHVGRTQTDQLDVKPREVGRVPLRLRFEYADRRGTVHSLKHTLYVDVARPATSTRGGVHIDSEQTDIGGDVVGRDKIVLAGSNVIIVGAGGRLEFSEKSVSPLGAAPLSPDDRESLERQLQSARENLRLIEERKAEFVLGTDVPLQLIKEEQRLRDKIAELEAKLHSKG
jgi:outer membrane protein assembly factor BamB